MSSYLAERRQVRGAGLCGQDLQHGRRMAHFGPDHRLVTPVKRDGRLVRGRLTGDLILVGKGDLTMGAGGPPERQVDYAILEQRRQQTAGATQNRVTRVEPARPSGQGFGRAPGERSPWSSMTACSMTFRLENLPVTPIVINNNLIDSPRHQRSPASVRLCGDAAKRSDRGRMP